MLVWTVKVLKLLNAMISVLVNLRKLVDHHFVKTPRCGLKVFFHSIERLHRKRQTFCWLYTLNGELSFVEQVLPWFLGIDWDTVPLVYNDAEVVEHWVLQSIILEKSDLTSVEVIKTMHHVLRINYAKNHVALEGQDERRKTLRHKVERVDIITFLVDKLALYLNQWLELGWNPGDEVFISDTDEQVELLENLVVHKRGEFHAQVQR